MSNNVINKIVEPFLSTLFVLDDKGIGTLSKTIKEFIENSSRQSKYHNMFSNIMSSLYATGESYLNMPGNEYTLVRFKTIAIVIFDNLLDVSDELALNRRSDIAGNLRRIFELDRPTLDIFAPVVRLAAACVGHFARVASTSEIEYLQNSYISLITKLLVDMKSDCHRFSGLIVLNSIAQNLPQLVYAKRKTVLSPLWELSDDKVSVVREAAITALESCLIVISQRETIIEYLRVALRNVDTNLSSNNSEDLMGGLMLFDMIINGNIISNTDLNSMGKSLNVQFQDLIWKVFLKKDVKDNEVSVKIINMLPRLAAAFPLQFCLPNTMSNPNTFLGYTIKYLLAVIKAKVNHSSAFLSMGNLFSTMSNQLRASPAVNDVIIAIQDGLRDTFCPEALHCLGTLVANSPLSRKYVNADLINMMFVGGFTADLIDNLKTIMKHVPTIRPHSQAQLKQHISSILQRYSIIVDDHVGKSRTSAIGRRASSMGGSSYSTSKAPAKSSSYWGSSIFGSHTPEVVVVSSESNEVSEHLIILALSVLSSSSFFPKAIRESNGAKGNGDQLAFDDNLNIQLLDILKTCVLKYLDDSNNEIRRTASLTCTAVLDTIVCGVDMKSNSYQDMRRIIDRLLLVCIGDEETMIRLDLLDSMTPSLDHLVSISENIECLVECTRDESIEVRASAMEVLARACHYDSLHIMPIIRVNMQQLIKQLHFAKNPTAKYNCVLLIQSIVRGSSVLIVPYVRQLLEPLLLLINDESPTVVDVTLSTIGDLGFASPESVQDGLNELFPSLIRALNDPLSNIKQNVALAAMGKLVPALTRVTEEPYSKFPGLLEGLIRAIQSDNGESDSDLRTEGIRTAGLLGVVGSEVYQNLLHSSRKKQNSELLLDDLNDSDSESSEDNNGENNDGDSVDETKSVQRLYFSVILRQLIDILRDDSLSAQHQAACVNAVKVVRNAGNIASNGLKQLIDAIFLRLFTSEPGNNLRETFIAQLAILVQIMGGRIRKYVKDFISIFEKYLQTYLSSCLLLLESLSEHMSFPDFEDFLQEITPALVGICKDEISSCGSSLYEDFLQSNTASVSVSSQRAEKPKKFDIKITERILLLIHSISVKIGDNIELLLSLVVSIACNVNINNEPRRKALACITKLCSEKPILVHFANSIVQPLIRLHWSRSDPLLLSLYTMLSWIVCVMQEDYTPFVIPVRRKLFSIFGRDVIKPIQVDEYENIVIRLLKRRSLPEAPSDMSELIVNWDSESYKNNSVGNSFLNNSSTLDNPNFKLNMQSLETAWALGNRSNASDLSEWMRRMSIELIRQSPSPLIRSCVTLAKIHRPLAEGLFNISFHCIWDELYAGESLDIGEDIPLISSIELALKSKNIPHNIMCALLNLTEFMDMQDRPLPIDVNLLAKRALSANMFAKCLRYREIEYSSKNLRPSGDGIQSLITVYNELGLCDRGMGVLQDISLNYADHINVDPLWLEKLGKWDDAKQLYSQILSNSEKVSLVQSSVNLSNELGKMRCYEALGEHQRFYSSAIRLKDQIKNFDQASEAVDINAHIPELQRLGAHASWTLGKWDDMESFLDMAEPSRLPPTSVSLTNNLQFYKAIMAIHKQDYPKATSLIADLRNSLSSGISALLSESYSRAYGAMVTMQILAEVEEVVDYKQDISILATSIASFKDKSPSDMNLQQFSRSTPFSKGVTSYDVGSIDIATKNLKAKKTELIEKWRKRLIWAPREVSIYRQIVSVHSLVIEPTEDLETWLDLVSLCRKEGMYSLCENILRQLGAPLPSTRDSDNDLPSVGLFAIPAIPIIKNNKQSVNNENKVVVDHDTSQVLLSTFKYWWASGEKIKALSELDTFLKATVQHVHRECNAVGSPSSSRSSSESKSSKDLTMLRVRCLLKKAEWMKEIDGGRFEEITDTLLEARDLAPDHYPAWHAWAVANFNQLQSVDSNNNSQPSVEHERESLASRDSRNFALSLFSSRNSGQVSHKGGASLANLLSIRQTDKSGNFIIEAIKGFVRSIILGNGQPSSYVLQDILRLLTLWFTYGNKMDVMAVLDSELEKLAPENWLSVVPQLIARLHLKSSAISGQLKKILTKVAAIHPQALVYPISVAMNTTDEQQKTLAREVLADMRKRRVRLVEEAQMVSKELMKVAISSFEQWFDGIEKACSLYLEGNIEGMVDILVGLHESMSSSLYPSPKIKSTIFDLDKLRKAVNEGLTCELGEIGFQTLRDISFRQMFGRQLSDAQSWFSKFLNSGKFVELHQAWELYYVVYKKIEGHIKTFKRLKLHHMSPFLTDANDLKLTVPGLYRPNETVVSIAKFSPSIKVIQSKQRPRKICIVGSNGVKYPFLLKGNEDLRQDERVMQLFGLINICLNNDRTTENRGLAITRYSVLPLSNNSGVIGWVENCDTLNQLVSEYRSSKGLKAGIEMKLLQSKSLNYDQGYSKNAMKNSLTLMQKVEIFKAVQDETTGQDVARMLWLRSRSADIWVERRANFTITMSLMSMAGYILGLGDRHPSNLMLDRVSGSVVHIDFGDCFEITKTRAKFPELIPFRLTRMLTTCMDRAGTEGTFRVNCERVMRVLRENKDSVMAMLEAFVYDPLISWKLFNSENKQNITDAPSEAHRQDSSSSAVSSRQIESAMEGSQIPQSPSRQDGNPVDMLRGKLGKLMRTISTKSNKSLDGDSATMDDLMLSSKKEGVQTNSLSTPELVRRRSSEDDECLPHNLNARAVEVILRIQSKLTGRDFVKDDDSEGLSVEQQVDRLIKEARSIENLCQLFVGWCPFW